MARLKARYQCGWGELSCVARFKLLKFKHLSLSQKHAEQIIQKAGLNISVGKAIFRREMLEKFVFNIVSYLFYVATKFD